MASRSRTRGAPSPTAHADDNGLTLAYARRILGPGERAALTYKVRADAPGTYTLSPTLTYTYDAPQGTVKGNASVEDERIAVTGLLNLSRRIEGDLDVDGTGKYTLALASEDSDESMDVDLTLALPQGIDAHDVAGFTQGTGRTLRARLTLDPHEQRTLSFGFTARGTGTFAIPLNATTTARGSSSTESYTDEVVVNERALAPSLRFSPDKASYPAGTSVAISGVLENTNPSLGFVGIGATLESPLFGSLTSAGASLDPGKALTRPTTTVRLPGQNSSRTYAVRFSGKYLSPKGKEFTFSASRDITVGPSSLPLDVTHEFEPAQAVPGGNLTVRVSATNLRGSYLTLEAQERYPPSLVQRSGLTHATSSLESDAQAQLYLYQVEIPRDIAGSSLNVTTVVTLKDAPAPLEFTAEVPIAAREDGDMPAPLQNATVDARASAPAAPGAEKKELGFFASIWDFLKGLFA